MALIRWHCLRSNRRSIFRAALIVALIYYFLIMDKFFEPDSDDDDDARTMEKKLREALKEDKGTGCNIPLLDPFSPEVMQFDKVKPKIECIGHDWVTCYLSKCKVKKEILDTLTNIDCTYRDIIYHNDKKYTLGPKVVVGGERVYELKNSDHVKISCVALKPNSFFKRRVSWTGHAAGLRATTKKLSPPGRENVANVLIFGFDSTSSNGFIRKMPKSYRKLKEMKATFLRGFNVLGDGTPATLFPILTGKNEVELPDVRRTKTSTGTVDCFPFIFYKLKDDGYRTAYFEDMPNVGTFNYRFNGFKKQPTDHYLRAFFLEEGKWTLNSFFTGTHQKYCVGDTPRYKVMMNLTQQFFIQGGKKFIFTFVADISHDDYNWISNSDEDFVGFLKNFLDNGWHDNTILFVMGDHGPRYADVRKTMQGKLEERLPLMSILLPERLKRERPNALRSLEENAEVLTTPHDIYATYLDAIGLRKYWNNYKVQGADFPRGMTLLEPIPSNRSCSEAGVVPHWCSCVSWSHISVDDPLSLAAAKAFIAHINKLTEDFRSQCVPRSLISIEWVMKQQAKNMGKLNENTKLYRENYQIKVVVGPGKAVYEASLVYLIDQKKFLTDTRDISRINAYGTEPSCISDVQPSLNMYCYCKEHMV